MILNSENNSDKQCHFLDINITITDKNTIITNVYDKRDDFNFNINNFPNLSGNVHYKRTHGMIISQLIRYGRICMNVDDFMERSRVMINKLCNQFFNKKKLKKKFSFFYDKYYHIIEKYNMNRLCLMKHIFI